MLGGSKYQRACPSFVGFRQVLLGFWFIASCLISLNAQSAAQSSPTKSAKALPSHSTSLSGQKEPTVLFQADLDCIFAVDDEVSQALKAGQIKRISATLGEHLITAVTVDGKDRWKTVVELDKPTQKVVLIELVRARAARQAGEREYARLKKEFDDTIIQTEWATRKAEDVKKQRQDILDQIDARQKQLRNEEAAAQEDESQAQQGRALAGTSAMQGTKSGNFMSLFDTVLAGSAGGSAANHRAKALELQNEIADLNRKLQRVGAEGAAPLSASPNVNKPPVAVSPSAPSGIEITTDGPGH